MKKPSREILQNQELKQVQRLILSPQMQQSLHLLQLPVLELSTVIADELEQNPLLEYTEVAEEMPSLLPDGVREQGGGKTTREEEDLKSFIENSIANETSLFDFLMQQAKEAFSPPCDLALAEAIIGNFDTNGFLNTSLDEIALLEDSDTTTLANILTLIQSFDPPGVGARDTRESFLIQLKLQNKECSLAYQIVDKHFEDMVHNRIPLIAKSFKCKPGPILKAIEQDISQLDMRPGANLPQGHYRLPISSIIPDIYILQNENGLAIEVNERPIPSLRFNWHYVTLLEDTNLPADARNFLEEKIAAGRSLLRNIYERHQTLYRITEELLAYQRPFFSMEEGALRPLTMKEIAASIGLHESTVVRAVANKYLSCPRGVFSFRSFFTHAYALEGGEVISSSSVKALLREIIQKEDRISPLSDEAISSLINAKGIPCARRTIVKYRQELGIGNASQRKSHR